MPRSTGWRSSPRLPCRHLLSRLSRWWLPPRRRIRPVSQAWGAAGGAGLVVAASLAGIAVAALAIQYLALRYFERAGRLGAADPAAAFADLDRAADLNPLWVQPHLRAGALAVRVGDPARARVAFGKALDIEGSWYAHLELALLDSQVGRFRSAGRQLELATRLNASDEFLAEARRRIRRRERIDPAAFNDAIQQRLSDLLGRPVRARAPRTTGSQR